MSAKGMDFPIPWPPHRHPNKTERNYAANLSTDIIEDKTNLENICIYVKAAEQALSAYIDRKRQGELKNKEAGG